MEVSQINKAEIELMTIIKKLSDRENFIFEAITLLLVNLGNMDQKRLQFELFRSGVYIKKPLLSEALKVMKENGQIGKPQPPVIQRPKIIVP